VLSLEELLVVLATTIGLTGINATLKAVPNYIQSVGSIGTVGRVKTCQNVAKRGIMFHDVA